MATVFGVGVFLTLLMVCSHVLLNLWITTSIDAVAHDAATDVATSGTAGSQRLRAQADALAEAGAALGDYSSEVEFAFESGPNDRQVVLRVRAPELTLFPAPLAGAANMAGLDRRIVVIAESPEPGALVPDSAEAANR